MHIITYILIYNLPFCGNFIIIKQKNTPNITNIRRGCISKDLRNCPISISLAALVIPQAGQGIPKKRADGHTVPKIKFIMVKEMIQIVIAKPYFFHNCL
jgi:hypothetical protein